MFWCAKLEGLILHKTCGYLLEVPCSGASNEYLYILWRNGENYAQIHQVLLHSKSSGPSCSKLTLSLVNIVKILIIKYGIYANSFAEKKCDLQKLLTFFQQKYLGIRYHTYYNS